MDKIGGKVLSCWCRKENLFGNSGVYYIQEILDIIVKYLKMFFEWDISNQISKEFTMLDLNYVRFKRCLSGIHYTNAKIDANIIETTKFTEKSPFCFEFFLKTFDPNTFWIHLGFTDANYRRER